MDLTRVTLRNGPLRLAVGALLSLVALAAVGASPSSALATDPDYWKQTADHRNTVYRFVYAESPHAIPTGYDPVREAEEITLREAQRTLPPSNSQVRALWQRIRTITVKSALSTAPRALGTIFLAKETFELGWKIGTGINAKYLRIGVPERVSLGLGTISQADWTEMKWSTANQYSLFGATWPAEPGWVAHFRNYQNYLDNRWFEAPCPYSGMTPPDEFEVLGPVGSMAECSYGTGQKAPVNVLYGWMAEDALGAPGPIEPYTNQPYSYLNAAPTPPPQTTVEQSIDTELAKPENADLRQWLNYQLGSPGETDPTGIGAPHPDIEFPDFYDHWTRHGGGFTTPYTDPMKYWEDAAEIVKRKEENGDPDILKCHRSGEDPADLYFDVARQAIVIVKGGKIVTYFVPDQPGMTPFEYWLSQCG